VYARGVRASRLTRFRAPALRVYVARERRRSRARASACADTWGPYVGDMLMFICFDYQEAHHKDAVSQVVRPVVIRLMEGVVRGECIEISRLGLERN
jgi:hypothetical protein